jgi:hypothetical protein
MIKKVIHHTERKWFALLNRFSKLGFASLVKLDCAPQTATFSPSDENYYF